MNSMCAPMKAFLFLEPKKNLTSIDFIQLPHPKSGENRWFGLSDDKLFEVIQVKDQNSSLMLSCDRAIQDGSLYLGSVIDPLFIILPELIKQAKSGGDKPRAVFPEQVFSSEIQKIIQLPSCRMQNIAKIQEAFGEQCIIYNPEKTMSWLKKKVDRLMSVLNGDETACLKESLGIIGEYLTSQWLNSLLKEYSLSVKEIYRSPRKRRLSNPEGPEAPTMKGPCRPAPQGPSMFSRNTSAPSTAKKVIKKPKPRPRGMKSLASYFGKR